ncbi:hypothetical protein DJ82_13730 [Halorubrum sp. Ib24]|uniref:hypothetical protein n=1 Tax=Halorubrum sp. Ib24 TaxID=1383850 RepID=UPI000B98168D|nr:hypothetical protein [Halorubrum sp. Ib24]OYR37997.1 hypothetical protein DJ82_13730 [Halorubrum sp. Ib24]
MDQLKEGYRRLRYQSELEDELEDTLVGKEFCLPIFETEQKQLLRQRSDYEELLFDLYGNPVQADLEIAHEKISYQISEVTVKEKTGVLYKLNRLLGRSGFQGWLEIELDFGEEELQYLDFHKHPLYEDLDARLDYYGHHSKLTIHYEFKDLEAIGELLFRFNRILATCWSAPDTIPELREETQKWEVYNQFKEKAR